MSNREPDGGKEQEGEREGRRRIDVEPKKPYMEPMST